MNAGYFPVCLSVSEPSPSSEKESTEISSPQFDQHVQILFPFNLQDGDAAQY